MLVDIQDLISVKNDLEIKSRRLKQFLENTNFSTEANLRLTYNEKLMKFSEYSKSGEAETDLARKLKNELIEFEDIFKISGEVSSLKKWLNKKKDDLLQKEIKLKEDLKNEDIESEAHFYESYQSKQKKLAKLVETKKGNSKKAERLQEKISDLTKIKQSHDDITQLRINNELAQKIWEETCIFDKFIEVFAEPISAISKKTDQTNNADLLEIDVLPDGSCLFYAITLSVLLPLVGKSSQFEAMFSLFFGKENKDAHVDIQKLLSNYDGNRDFIKNNIPQLEVLIDIEFRKQLVLYMEQHRESLIAFFDENETFEQRLSTIRKPKTWGDQTEIEAASQFLKLKINVSEKDDGGKLIPRDPHGESFGNENAIFLVFTPVNDDELNAKKIHYHYLIKEKFIHKSNPTALSHEEEIHLDINKQHENSADNEAHKKSIKPPQNGNALHVEELDNEALIKFLKTPVIDKLISKDKKQLIQYVDEKNQQRFKDFVMQKIGEDGKEQLEQDLRNTYGDDYDFNSIAVEIFSHQRQEKLTQCLEKNNLKGKNIYLDLKKSGIYALSGQELPFSSKSGQVKNVSKTALNVHLELDDGSKITVFSVKAGKPTAVKVEYTEHMNFHRFLKSLFEVKNEKMVIEVKILENSFSHNNNFELAEGLYHVERITNRQAPKPSVIKSLLFTLSSKKDVSLYEQSFSLNKYTNKGLTQKQTITIYDSGAVDQIIEIKIDEQILDLLSSQKCQFFKHKEFKNSLKESVNIDDIFMISFDVQDNERNVKTEKMEKLDKTEKNLIRIFLYPNNTDILNSLLDDFLKNNLKTIKNDLSAVSLFDKEKKKSVKLYPKLEKMAQLCRDLEFYKEHNDVLEKFMLMQVISKVNYARVVQKQQNLSVLKTMELLKEAFTYVEQMKNKELMLFFGDTGSGKSTTLNYFSGINLKESKSSFGVRTLEVATDDKSSPHAKIGQSVVTSETKFVQAYPIKMRVFAGEDSNSGYMDLSKVMLCDCPGFGDSRGIHYDISTKFSIAETFKTAAGIKAIILVVPYDAFSSSYRSAPLVRLFKELETTIPAIKNNPELLKSIFLVVTKHPNPQDASQSFKQGLTQCGCEVASQIESSKDEAERSQFIEKQNVWQFLISLSERNVHFVNIEGKSLRTKFLKQILLQDGIQKTLFPEMMNDSMDKLAFYKHIQMSANSWQEFIIKPFLEGIPNSITTHKQEMKKSHDTIQKNKTDIFESSNTIKAFEKEIEIKQKLKEEFLDLMRNNRTQDAYKLIEKEVSADSQNSEISVLEASKGDLQKKLNSLEMDKKEKEQDRIKKLAKYDGLIKLLEEEAKKKTAEAVALSTGSKQIELYEKSYKQDQVLELRTWKTGAREAAHKEMRSTVDSDYLQDEHGKVIYENTSVKDFTGELAPAILISQDYRIVPKDKAQRELFEKQRKAVGETGHRYEANIEGENWELDLGIKTESTGKTVAYGIKLKFEHEIENGKTVPKKGRVLPWLKISHTIANRDLNEAAITNLDAEKIVIGKNVTEYTKLRDDIANNTNNFDNVAIKTTEENINKTRDLIDSTQQGIDGIKVKKVTETNFDKIRDTEIGVKKKNIIRENKSIDEYNETIHIMQENIKNSLVAINLLLAKRKYLAIIIEQQFQILELLYQLSEYAVQFIRYKENETHPDNFSETCGSFNDYYKKNAENLKIRCKDEIDSCLLSMKAVESFRSGSLVEALEYFGRELSINEDSLMALQGKAVILLYQGNFKEGSSLLEDADNRMRYESQEQQIILWLARAELFIIMKRYGSAKSCCLKVQELSSDNTDAKKVLEKIESLNSLFVKNANTFFRTFTMKASTSINLIDAVNHVWEDYLSKPYTLESYKVDWKYNYGNNVIQRPNHGLAHTLRTIFYVPYVVQFFLDCKTNPYCKHPMLEKMQTNIKIIQLALLFFVVGRENDMESDTDPTAYNQFRINSAKAFKKYITEKKLQLDMEVYDACYEGILKSDFKAGPIQAILKICHNIDVMRCFDHHTYQSVCAEITPYIGEKAREDLAQLVNECLIQTGDRISAKLTDNHSYDGRLFVQASQDAVKCEEFICLAIEMWENKQMNHFQLI